MIKAGIKKELMLFARGFKLLGVIITIVAISLLYPFTYKSMELMANQISDMGQQMGGENRSKLAHINRFYCNNVTAYVSRRRRTEKTLGNNTYLCRTVTLRLCNA